MTVSLPLDCRWPNLLSGWISRYRFCGLFCWLFCFLPTAVYFLLLVFQPLLEVIVAWFGPRCLSCLRWFLYSPVFYSFPWVVQWDSLGCHSSAWTPLLISGFWHRMYLWGYLLFPRRSFWAQSSRSHTDYSIGSPSPVSHFSGSQPLFWSFNELVSNI